ncbi:MAG: tRNA lysidine(34) synthetase TilS [Anaerovibrio sp.]|nr:tRNA lysidine(34) synthetase TilS [Anaerovibrio sp.]
MEIEKRLIKYWQHNALAKAGDTVLVACSGGPDSLALLDLLHGLSGELSIEVMAAHYEHGIRGQASVDDANFVQQYCQREKIDFFLESGDIPLICRQTGESLETCSRRMRYGFLHRIAREKGCAVIATAHHSDDQAETVLMHILRGTGLNGLTGILPKRDNIIRPLLAFTKCELVDYCKAQGLAPRLDATNEVADCTRNRIRLELLPYLKQEYNINITDQLCQLARIVSADENLLDSICRTAFDKICVADARGAISCKADDFLLQPLSIQRRLLQQMGGSLQVQLSFPHVEQIRELVEKNHTGKHLMLPQGCQAGMRYGILTLSKMDRVFSETDGNMAFKDRDLVLEPGGRLILEDGSMLCSEITADLEIRKPFSKNMVYFDAAKSGDTVLVRYRRKGDRLLLPAGHKKLKDLLIDSKVDVEKRNNIPVVVSSITNEIIWVAGIRQTAAAMAGADTGRYLILSYIQKGEE